MRAFSPRALKLWLLALSPAFLAVLGVVVPRLSPGNARQPSPYALEVSVLRRNGRERRVPPGAPLSPGAKVILRLSTERPGYLTVLDVDSARRVKQYVPGQGAPVAIPAGPRQPLDANIQLGEALGPERFIALVCEAPVPEEQVRAAAEHSLKEACGNPARMAALDLPCQQAMFLIEKVAPL